MKLQRRTLGARWPPGSFARGLNIIMGTIVASILKTVYKTSGLHADGDLTHTSNLDRREPNHQGLSRLFNGNTEAIEPREDLGWRGDESR